MILRHNNLGLWFVDAELAISDLHIAFLLGKKFQYFCSIIIRSLETFGKIKIVEINDLVNVSESYEVPAVPETKDQIRYLMRTEDYRKPWGIGIGWLRSSLHFIASS